MRYVNSSKCYDNVSAEVTSHEVCGHRSVTRTFTVIAELKAITQMYRISHKDHNNA